MDQFPLAMLKLISEIARRDPKLLCDVFDPTYSCFKLTEEEKEQWRMLTASDANRNSD